MKILTVSDEVCKGLYDYYAPGKLDGYDLIISCGDLKPQYLSFLVTMTRVPLLYVHGNHDGRYEKTPPEGCDCIEDKLIVYKGVVAYISVYGKLGESCGICPTCNEKQ